MLRLVLAPALALTCATVALAQDPAGKRWDDATCAVSLSSVPDGTFTIASPDRGGYSAQCRIDDWPVSSPSAKMACQDGTKASMALLAGDVVVWGGSPFVGAGEPVTLFPRGDKRNRCEGRG